jgi:hypothetical protein
MRSNIACSYRLDVLEEFMKGKKMIKLKSNNDDDEPRDYPSLVRSVRQTANTPISIHEQPSFACL